MVEIFLACENFRSASIKVNQKFTFFKVFMSGAEKMILPFLTKLPRLWKVDLTLLRRRQSCCHLTTRFYGYYYFVLLCLARNVPGRDRSVLDSCENYISPDICKNVLTYPRRQVMSSRLSVAGWFLVQSYRLGYTRAYESNARLFFLEQVDLVIN